jgi:hypothetical protein
MGSLLPLRVDVILLFLCFLCRNLLTCLVSLLPHDLVVAINLLQSVPLLDLVPLHHSLSLCVCHRLVVGNQIECHVVQECLLVVLPKTTLIHLSPVDSAATAWIIVVYIVSELVFLATNKVFAVSELSLSLALQITFLGGFIEYFSLESILLVLGKLRVGIYLVDALLRSLAQSYLLIEFAVSILLHLAQLLSVHLHHVLHVNDTLIIL